jgi:hypothetical protein
VSWSPSWSSEWPRKKTVCGLSLYESNQPATHVRHLRAASVHTYPLALSVALPPVGVSVRLVRSSERVLLCRLRLLFHAAGHARLIATDDRYEGGLSTSAARATAAVLLSSDAKANPGPLNRVVIPLTPEWALRFNLVCVRRITWLPLKRAASPMEDGPRENTPDRSS